MGIKSNGGILENAARRTYFIVTVCFFTLALLPSSAQAAEVGPAPYLDNDFQITSGFTSPLPVVVMKSDGSVDIYSKIGKPISSSQPNYYAQQEDMETDNTVEAKSNHLLSFSSSDQDDLSQELWGWSGCEPDWYLMGDGRDKSLMRNYLALSLYDAMGENASGIQHVEVLFEGDDGYLYQGVYLLVAPRSTSNVILQRGEPTKNDQPLYTYAVHEGFVDQPLYIPSADAVSEEERLEIEQGISRMEESIYSVDYDAFSHYNDFLDIEKLLDFFILYEYFGNYEGAQSATYEYNREQEILWPTTSPNFGTSLDNNPDEIFDYGKIGLMDTPYFDSLIRSTVFLGDLQKRYRTLYQDLLNDSAINERIDGIVKALGDAKTRDWARWRTEYSQSVLDSEPSSDSTLTIAGDEKPVIDRNSSSYDSETTKLKYLSDEHGRVVFNGIASLYQRDELVGEDASYIQNTISFLIFLVLVILSVAVARRRMRE